MKTHALWIVLVLWLFAMPLAAQEEAYISAIAYSKDGNRLALGYSDGGLEVFDVEGTVLGDRLFGDQALNPILSIEWHPFNNNLLLVTTNHETVITLDLALPEPDYS